MLIGGELTSGTVVRIEAGSDDSSLDDCGVAVTKQKLNTLKYRYIKNRKPRM
jgi:hypothetical protein